MSLLRSLVCLATLTLFSSISSAQGTDPGFDLDALIDMLESSGATTSVTCSVSFGTDSMELDDLGDLSELLSGLDLSGLLGEAVESGSAMVVSGGVMVGPDGEVHELEGFGDISEHLAGLDIAGMIEDAIADGGACSEGTFFQGTVIGPDGVSIDLDDLSDLPSAIADAISEIDLGSILEGIDLEGLIEDFELGEGNCFAFTLDEDGEWVEVDPADFDFESCLGDFDFSDFEDFLLDMIETP